MQNSLKDRFGFVYDVIEIVNSMEFNDSETALENIHATLPIVGDVVIIDFTYLNQHASFFRGILSAFVYFLIGIYMIREAPKVLGFMS